MFPKAIGQAARALVLDHNVQPGRLARGGEPIIMSRRVNFVGPSRGDPQVVRCYFTDGQLQDLAA